MPLGEPKFLQLKEITETREAQERLRQKGIKETIKLLYFKIIENREQISFFADTSCPLSNKKSEWDLFEKELAGYGKEFDRQRGVVRQFCKTGKLNVKLLDLLTEENKFDEDPAFQNPLIGSFNYEPFWWLTEAHNKLFPEKSWKDLSAEEKEKVEEEAGKLKAEAEQSLVSGLTILKDNPISPNEMKTVVLQLNQEIKEVMREGLDSLGIIKPK